MSETNYAFVSPSLGAWAQNLQPASWRGVPFAVASSTIRRGRRTALHEYPDRDAVWVEDLGRGVRRISIVGFVIGDDVFDQRDQMVDACEVAGPGSLVHPSLGTISVCLEGDIAAVERADRGRVVEIECTFIETTQDQPVYPSSDTSTQDDSLDAADACDTVSSSDFSDDVAGAIDVGAAVVQGGIETVTSFAAVVVGTVQTAELIAGEVLAVPDLILGAVLSPVTTLSGLINDAAVTAGLAYGLVGNFGRYASGGLAVPLPASATIQTRIAAATVARAALVAATATALSTAASAPAGLPAAIQVVVAKLLATVPGPADQLRLLAVLANFNPPTSATSAPIGAAVATVQSNIAATVRRAACSALARAAAAYLPTSYNDAITQLDDLTAILDDEALTAADAGDTASYQALTRLRVTVTADLLTRGAQLPKLMTVTTPISLPSLVLAWDLYGDATRADDLTARADPVNPMFMPTSFLALSS